MRQRKDFRARLERGAVREQHGLRAEDHAVVERAQAVVVERLPRRDEVGDHVRVTDGGRDFERAFGVSGVRQQWFAQFIQNAFIATITGHYRLEPSARPRWT